MSNIKKLVVSETWRSGNPYRCYILGDKGWEAVDISEFKDRFEVTFRESRLVINKARLVSWEIVTNG